MTDYIIIRSCSADITVPAGGSASNAFTAPVVNGYKPLCAMPAAVSDPHIVISYAVRDVDASYNFSVRYYNWYSSSVTTNASARVIYVKA